MEHVSVTNSCIDVPSLLWISQNYSSGSLDSGCQIVCELHDANTES